jgi:acetyl esterase
VKLWSDEIDALREEARAASAAGLAGLEELLGRNVAPARDPLDRLRQQREVYLRFPSDPSGVDREIEGIRCRVFRPEGSARAVYLHFHGGGMTQGVPEMNDLPNAALARNHGVAVVSVDYRLAPEHPYPAGPDDGAAVARWLIEHAPSEFGSERMLIGGESAGGYMAAVVLLRMRDELDAVDRVLGANLVFGVYDWGRSPSQRGIRPHDGPDILDPEGILRFTDWYVPDRTDDERRDPAISPAFADLRGLPNALMSVGTCDHLLDDTLMLASRWAAAGNELELFVAPDLPHGFMAIPCEITSRWGKTVNEWFAARLADA